jgi:quercetin dioxygenase-like cupin family protein
VTVIALEDLPASATASRFEGRDHGSSLSFFLSHHPPGTGPSLHRHPYDETFLIQGGVATFTVDGEEIEAHEGQIVVVPAGAAHAFVSSGEHVLRQISVHPCDHLVTEFLES